MATEPGYALPRGPRSETRRHAGTATRPSAHCPHTAMGGNKKFIDKKASATYSLICRANDDGDDPAASLADERVLARVDVRDCS